jgi:hypothetical protein
MAVMPKPIEFCLPTSGKAVPSGPDWIHEVKYDGYRLRVERDGDACSCLAGADMTGAGAFPGLRRQPGRSGRPSSSSTARLWCSGWTFNAFPQTRPRGAALNRRGWNWPEKYPQHLFFPDYAYQFMHRAVMRISTSRMI